MRSPAEHFQELERLALLDLAAAMRRTGERLARDAASIIAGSPPSSTSIRSDMLELEHALRAHDKARAAAEAVEAALAGGEASR